MTRRLPPRWDFAIRLLLAFVLTLALVPVVALVLPNTAFHRLVTRTLLVCILALLLVGRSHPRTWGANLRAMGLRGPAGLSRLATGILISIVLFGFVLAISWATSGRQITAIPDDWLYKIVAAALTGLGVGILEETLWRGYLRGLMGATVSSFLYAAAHYFRPLDGSPPAPGPYDPLMAVRRLPEMFEALGEPRFVTLGMVSLFILGMALSRLRQRTGTLWMSIGVHAGFVFAIALYRIVLQADPSGSLWIHGGSRVHDGLLGIAAVGFLWWAAGRVPRAARVSTSIAR